MHRTEGANNVANLYANGPPSTTVEENSLNAWQEEIANVIEEAGITLLTPTTDTRDQLKGAIKTIGNMYAIVQDVKAANTPGGGFTLGAWRTRTLNTISTNISGVSLGSNQITLPAGTYKVVSLAPAFAVLENKAKLYNVTDAADELIGTSEYASTAASCAVNSRVSGIFTIASAKVFEIRHQSAATKGTDGFGLESNFGIDEIYTQVEIIKIAD